MITGSEIYWLTRMDNIRVVLAILFCVGTLFTLVRFIVGLIIAADSEPGSDKEKDGCKRMKYALLHFTTLSIFIIARGFVPTTKEMCAIKAIPMIANNNQVQELPNKVVELANEWIDELKPDNKE